MKWIQMLEEVKHTSGRYYRDEKRYVPPEIAQQFCANGWAKDLDGELQTQPRSTQGKTLAVNNASHKSTATNPKVK
jgi:hypothetical protein